MELVTRYQAILSNVTNREEFSEIDLETDEFSLIENIEKLGNEWLKKELMRRGLKCGGTLQEKALRLFSVRGILPQDINPKLKSK